MADYYSEKNDRLHTFFLDNRQAGTVTGVIDVISFNDKEILLKTVAGTMTIRGGNLALTRLDLEKQETDMQGEVDSVVYSKSLGGKRYGREKQSEARGRNRTSNMGWLEQLRNWW